MSTVGHGFTFVIPGTFSLPAMSQLQPISLTLTLPLCNGQPFSCPHLLSV